MLLYIDLTLTVALIVYYVTECSDMEISVF